MTGEARQLRNLRRLLAACGAAAGVVFSGCDLELTKTAPAVAHVGTPFTSTITVRNKPFESNGCARDNVQVVDMLPENVQFISVDPAKGTCSGPDGAGKVTCMLGTLAVDEEVAIALVLRPTTIGVLTNTATVSGDQCFGRDDPEPGNDTGTAVTEVRGVAAPVLSMVGLLCALSLLGLVGWLAQRRGRGMNNAGVGV